MLNYAWIELRRFKKFNNSVKFYTKRRKSFQVHQDLLFKRNQFIQHTSDYSRIDVVGGYVEALRRTESHQYKVYSTKLI